jgi:hypothetical protein
VLRERCGGGSGCGRLFIAEDGLMVDTDQGDDVRVHGFAIGQLGGGGASPRALGFSGARRCAGKRLERVGP